MRQRANWTQEVKYGDTLGLAVLNEGNTSRSRFRRHGNQTLKNRFTAFCLSVLLPLSLCACSMQGNTEGPSPAPEASIAEPQAAPASARTVTDMSGAQVELPEEIHRVVCIQPTLTEYMIGFGLKDVLVGTHKNTLQRPWLLKLCPQAADIRPYSYSASAEDILAIGADLVIVPGQEEAEILRNAGIPTVVISLNNSGDPYEHVRLLGQIFGEPAAKHIEQWIAEVETVKNSIEAKLDAAGVESGPKAYVINGHSNKGFFYPAGGGGSVLEYFFNEIRIPFALKDFPGDGNVPTEEEILETNPEVILIGGAYGAPMCKELLADPVWADVTAVKNGSVYPIPIGGIGWDQGYLSMPIALQYYAQVCYPDLFPNDLTPSVIDFYQRFFDVTLTEADVENMFSCNTPEGTAAWEE